MDFGFREWGTVPTHLSCPVFSHRQRAHCEEQWQDKWQGKRTASMEGTVRGTPLFILSTPTLHSVPNPFDTVLRPLSCPTTSQNAARLLGTLPLPPINPSIIMSALFCHWRLSSVYRCTGSQEIPHLCSLWISPVRYVVH